MQSSNLQIELKDGRIHDRHTVYYKSFASEKVMKNIIDKYVERTSKFIKKKNINKNYHLNFIELKGNNVGYGYIYFPEYSFYYMLTDRKPNGKPNGEWVKNENYVDSETRKKITKERYDFYKSCTPEQKKNTKWSWVFEYDYDDNENEINGNEEKIFVKESFCDLGEYNIDDYSEKSIKAYIDFKKLKEDNSDFSELKDIKIGDKLKISTSVISFKYDNYIDTISITGFPSYMKNDEVLELYSMFFEENIKNYIKKINTKNYDNTIFIEVTFKLKQYAQLLNIICRNLNILHKNDSFVLKNKPIKNNHFN
jgi:hypothetical protein